MTTAFRAHTDAVDCQDAPNAAALINCWAGHVSDIMAEADSTQAFYDHPANVLFAHKLASLMGLDVSEGRNAELYGEAYRVCSKVRGMAQQAAG